MEQTKKREWGASVSNLAAVHFFFSRFCRCSLRSDCQDAAKDPLYWISYKSGRCTTITSVTPNQLQRTTARTVYLFFILDDLDDGPRRADPLFSRPSLTVDWPFFFCFLLFQLSLVIDNLPTLSGQFQCAFSAFGKTLLTNATRTANGVSCTTPRTDHIPANPPGQRERFVFPPFDIFILPPSFSSPLLFSR